MYNQHNEVLFADMSSINHEIVNEVIPISTTLSEPSKGEHGKRIILPKAIIGDPRSMHKRYLDAKNSNPAKN